MKKTSIFLIVTFWFMGLFAQQQSGQFFNLTQPFTGGEYEYIASEEITLLPGFQYTPLNSSDYFIGRIDPYMVFPPDDGDLIGGPPGNNEGGLVGTLPGNLMVSPSGAAIYSIPIELPSGVNGMTPQLGLVYNSQGGNGLLGLGWSLTGLSSITRTGTTIYHNEYIDGVDFDGNDQYMLDGQRLIPVNTQNTEFRTEIESFSRIKADGTAGDGPLSFKVETKSGQTFYYGTEPSSRIEASGRDAILTWHLTSLEDQMGNYITFIYRETGGLGIIDKIQYGANRITNQQHFYEIQFDYQNFRNDIIRQFIAGSSIVGTDLLTGIRIKYQGQLLNTYKLDYEQGMYSRLQKVWLYDGDTEGQHFNPIVAEWASDNGHTNNELLTPTESSGTQYDQFFLDINGDGLTDIIKIEWELWQPGPNLPGMKKALNWFFRLRSENNTFLPIVEFEVGPLEWYRNLLIGDYNGDGLEDFIVIGYLNNTPDRFYIDGLMLSTGGGFEYYYINDISGLFINKPEFRTGDFDGDGITELLAVYKDKTVNYDNDPNNDEPDVYIWKLNETSPSNVLVFSAKMTFGNTDFNKSVIVVSDFNGDGRSDILRTAEYGGNPHTSNCFIYSVNIPTNQLEIIHGTESNGYPSTWHQLYPGDFNGDGITDLLTYTYGSENPTWEVACFNGQTGFSTMSAPLLANFNLYEQVDAWYYSLNLADYNGDGKTDIMQLHKIQNTTTAEYIIYYSNGNTFSETSSGFISMIGGLASGGVVQYEHVHPSFDFNGDGHDDLYVQGVIYNGDFVELFDCDNKYNLIKSFKNGLGQITEQSFSPLTNSEIYTKGTGPNHTDVIDIQPALYVVESVVSEDGIGGFITNKYEYKGAKIHKKGKGFLGFQQLTTSNYQNTILKSQAVSTFELDPTYYFSWQINNKTYVKKEGIGLKLINETWSEPPVIQDFTNKRFFYYTPRTLTKTYSIESQGSVLLSTQLSTQYYSPTDIEQGNVTSTGTYVDNQNYSFDFPSGEYSFRTEQSLTYYPPNPNKWLFGLVNEHETTIMSNEDATTNKQKKTYMYRPNTSLVISETMLPNDDEQFQNILEFDYSVYGNVKSSRLSAPGVEPRLTEFEYDVAYQHRFVSKTIKKLDGVSYIKSSFYEAETGLLNHEIDANDLTTLYQHDVFGKPTQVKHPDNTLQKTQTYWAGDHPDKTPSSLYYQWSQASGLPETLVFYDRFGRVMRAVSHDYHGNKIYTDEIYNAKGLLLKESVPYLADNQQMQYTQYEYDEINRPIIVTMPDNTTISYEYNGNSIKTTNTLNQTTEKITNVVGWLKESVDANGVKVFYTYFSDGKLKNTCIEDSPSTMVSMEYNKRGQQTLLTDPDYGTVQYTYDAYDQLVQQVSPRNDKTTMVYDGFGRMIEQTDPEGITIWSYNTTPGTKGTLKFITLNGHTTSFTYDNLLRTTSQTESINGENYTTAFTYDALSRLKKTIHPSGVGTINYYNAQGELYTIRSTTDEQLLWKTNRVNHLGQLELFTVGNELQTEQTYDPQTKRLTAISTKYQAQIVQDLEYDWDHIGNLSSRTKWINRPQNQKLTESFTYDALNRLETISLNNEPSGMHAYDNLGNIALKKVDGNVIFDNAKYGETYDGKPNGPHALTSALTTKDVFPVDIQNIEYNTFDKLKVIKEGNKLLNVSYGNHRQRIMQEFTDENTTITKRWAGACEYIDTNGTTRLLTYLSGPQGVFALVEKQQGINKIFYIHKDHLGSWNTITDTKRNLLQELSFDSWGTRRDPETWRVFKETPLAPIYDRGFTGHEHLYSFGLINMNGRVYDPTVSRMLSPDNYVQSPDFSQSFNRYSYCLNNPHIYTDPTGEIVWFVPIVYAAVNVTADLIANDFKMNIGEIAVSAASGAIGGLIGGAGITTVGGVFLSAGVGQLNRFLPSIPIYQSSSFNLSLSPMVGFGSHGFNFGANLNASGQVGDLAYSACIGAGYNSGMSSLGESAGSSSFWNGGGFVGYNDGHANYGLGYSYNSFGGNTGQGVGAVTAQIGDFAFRFDEDWGIGDREDRYRTGGALATYKVSGDLTLAFGGSMITGDGEGGTLQEGNPNPDPSGEGMVGTWNPEDEKMTYLRGGTMYGGVIYKGQSYFAGNNSEKRLHSIQNWIHKNVAITTPYFYDHGLQSRSFGYYGGFNSNYLFY